MRQKHDLEVKFEEWKKAGYGNNVLTPLQNQEVQRAFMGGVFEGLNFLIDQLENKPEEMDENIKSAYRFLKMFHENQIIITQDQKTPFGKRFY